MAWALLQKSLEPPSIDQLRTAFRGVPGLTAYDSFSIGKDAFGILVKGFSLDAANILKTNLAAQGVDTELVDESTLPPLPAGRGIHRLDCNPDSLIIYDPLNRTFPLPWDKILLLAAARVNLDEFNQVRTEVEVPDYSSRSPADALLGGVFGVPRLGPARTTTVVNFETKEQHHDRWLLDIVITGGALRYSLVADKCGPLLFQYLADRRTNDLAANFTLLVQDLIKFAPQAAINRGAYYLRENSPTPFRYPTKNAFYQEIIWLLRQMSTSNA